MNNIVVGSQVTFGQGSGQPGSIASTVQGTSSTISSSVIPFASEISAPEARPENGKPRLRLNGIYSNDLPHPLSSPLEDNNDDSNAAPLHLLSPSLILTNDEETDLPQPQSLTTLKCQAENLGDSDPATGSLKDPQLLPAALSPVPFAGSLGKSGGNGVIRVSGGCGDEAGSVAEIDDGDGRDALQVMTTVQDGGNRQNLNLIVAGGDEAGRPGCCHFPTIQLQVQGESNAGETRMLVGDSAAVSGNSQLPGPILTHSGLAEPESHCQVAQETTTATSCPAADSNILNIASPATGLLRNSEDDSNSGSSVISAGTIISSSSGLPEPELYIPRDFSSLNRADLEELHRHWDMLDPYQRRLVKMIEDKVALHPQRYERDDYLHTATFLILSDWPSAEKLSFCGIPSKMNKSGRCCLHPFCPYCCWKVRTEAQVTYVPSFYEGTWHWLTGSFDGELAFAGADGFNWLHYWDAYKHGLEALIREGLIDGAYWTEELAVNSLLPARVLPHIHAVIDAHELTDSTLDVLKENVIEYLNRKVLESEDQNFGPDFLRPNIKTKPIADEKTLLDRIGYMNKTVKLLKPYQQAWVGASFHNRYRAWELNSQLTDLIKGHAEITRRRPKMKSKGTLNPRDKRFIGIKTRDRGQRQYRELVNELKKQPTEFIQDDGQAESEEIPASNL